MERRLPHIFGSRAKEEKSPPKIVDEKDNPQASFELQKHIDEFKPRIEEGLAELFPNPNFRSRTLRNPLLNWQEKMPQTYKDNPHFEGKDVKSVVITRDNSDGNEWLSLDFSLDGGCGGIEFEYSDNNCKITTVSRGAVDDEIEIVEDSKDPIAYIVRLSRVLEAVEFIRAERNHRLISAPIIGNL